jgi:hypothetical protein
MKVSDLFFITAFILFIIFSIDSYCTKPVVYWSTSCDQCVRVTYDGVESSCDELPNEYTRTWVK